MSNSEKKETRTIIHRNPERDNFTIVPNQGLRRADLSWKAKGILSYLFSLPSDWVIYLEEVATHSTDGRDAFRSGWNELKDAGYVERFPIREKGKIIRWETIINHYVDMTAISPLTDFPEVANSVKNEPYTDFPEVAKPEVADPHLANPTLLITDNTNYLITKDLNKRDDDDTRARETSIQEPNPEPKENPVSDSDRQKLNCRAYFEASIAPLTDDNKIKLDSWVEDMGEDMVLEAIFRGIVKEARTYSYINTTLQTWIVSDIKTVDAIKADDKKHNRKFNYRNDPQTPASTQNNRPQKNWNNYGKQPKQEITPNWATDETAEAKLRQETPPTDDELARQVAERIAKLKSSGKSDEDLAKMR